MPELSPEELIPLLRSPEWREQSNVAIAEFTGCDQRRISILRNQLGLKPDVVLRRNGRPIRTRLLGKRRGRVLTTLQRERMAALNDWCERLATRLENDVLDRERLLDLAHDALIVAVKYWRPRQFTIGDGAERTAVKWRVYAKNGVRQAIRRAFHKARRNLRQTALTGRLPYQEQVIEARLENSLGPLYDQYTQMSGPLKLVIEGVAGLDGLKPWTEADLARYWLLEQHESRQLLASAKAELLE